MPGPCEGCSRPCDQHDGECLPEPKPITELSTAEKIALMEVLANGNNLGNPED